MNTDTKDISTNQLRAISAFCLLILALTSIVLKQTSSVIDCVLIALASFLVGGAVLSNIGKQPTN